MKAFTVLATKTGLIILASTSNLEALPHGLQRELASSTAQADRIAQAPGDSSNPAPIATAREPRLEDGTPALRRALGLDETPGALVHELDPSSPLAMRGLRAGDLIVAIENRPIDSAATARAVFEARAHDSPRVTVLRQGSRFDLPG